jgi:hypothetical protein
LRAAHTALSPVMTPATAPGGDDGIDVRAEVVRTALYEVLEGQGDRVRGGKGRFGNGTAREVTRGDLAEIRAGPRLGRHVRVPGLGCGPAGSVDDRGMLALAGRVHVRTTASASSPLGVCLWKRACVWR